MINRGFSFSAIPFIQERRFGMTLSEQIRMSQTPGSVKEMTRRAIKFLEELGEYCDDLKSEFFRLYGEAV